MLTSTLFLLNWECKSNWCGEENRNAQILGWEESGVIGSKSAHRSKFVWKIVWGSLGKSEKRLAKSSKLAIICVHRGHPVRSALRIHRIAKYKMMKIIMYFIKKIRRVFWWDFFFSCSCMVYLYRNSYGSGGFVGWGWGAWAY
jgi:hypothetical protein